MENYKHLTHTFCPVYNNSSRILILGTFPSVKSREEDFYYGHPRNRFWNVISLLLNEAYPNTIDEKRCLLLTHNIALWDVIQSCDIIGSADSTIKNVTPADIPLILDNAPIKAIFANGTKAYDLYQKYTLEKTNFPIAKLPSTSPANASYSIKKLQDNWKVILQYL